MIQACLFALALKKQHQDGEGWLAWLCLSPHVREFRVWFQLYSYSSGMRVYIFVIKSCIFFAKQ